MTAAFPRKIPLRTCQKEDWPTSNHLWETTWDNHHTIREANTVARCATCKSLVTSTSLVNIALQVWIHRHTALPRNEVYSKTSIFMGKIMNKGEQPCCPWVPFADKLILHEVYSDILNHHRLCFVPKAQFSLCVSLDILGSTSGRLWPAVH